MGGSLEQARKIIEEHNQRAAELRKASAASIRFAQNGAALDPSRHEDDIEPSVEIHKYTVDL